MYAEIIYESGEHSIAQYDSEDEMLKAIKEHHRRAVNGEKFQTRGSDEIPAGPATRVKRVLVYDDHPADLTQSGLIEDRQVANLVAQCNQGGLISVHELASALRNELDPTVESGAHESNYKMKEQKELDPNSWSAE